MNVLAADDVEHPAWAFDSGGLMISMMAPWASVVLGDGPRFAMRVTEHGFNSRM